MEELLLQRDVEQFLYREAALIDDRRFNEWLELLDGEFRLFVPITRNIRYDNTDAEKTRAGQDISWFEEDKENVAKRIAQISTGLHWAEEPRSRSVHLISNVRLVEVTRGAAEVEVVKVDSAFMIYRNRGQDETDHLVGRRSDVLRKMADGWRVLRREVDLAQTVLLAKNFTTFF